MERIVIIDDSGCKTELDQLLAGNRDAVKLDSNLATIKAKARQLLDDISENKTHEKKLKVENDDQIIFIKTNQIIRIEGKGKHAVIFLNNGLRQQVNSSIDILEKKLGDQPFLRIHDMHLVNVVFISKIDLSKSPGIELSNGENLCIQSGRSKIVADFFQDFTDKNDYMNHKTNQP